MSLATSIPGILSLPEHVARSCTVRSGRTADAAVETEANAVALRSGIVALANVAVRDASTHCCSADRCCERCFAEG